MGHSNRGDALAALSRDEEAHEEYRQAAERIADQIAARPGDLWLRPRRVLYLAKAGQCAETVAESEAVLTELPDTVDHLMLLAEALASCDEAARAVPLLVQALDAGAAPGRLCGTPVLRPLLARPPLGRRLECD